MVFLRKYGIIFPVLGKILEEGKLMTAVNFWKQRLKNVHSNVMHSVVLENYTANQVFLKNGSKLGIHIC